MKDFIKIVEVGPRDGLQNETQTLSIAQRLDLITDLVNAGLRYIEVGSCVSAKWVPQMAQSDLLFQQLPATQEVVFSLLTPNMQGFEAAQAAGCQEIAVFTAASESFTRKNINCSIDESLEKFAAIVDAAKAKNIRVRGYVSCVIDCPYEGAIAPEQVLSVAKRLYDMGCYEISLGDTIGSATPNRVKQLWQVCLTALNAEVLSGHFHNTYGMAIANIVQSIQQGIRIFDSSIAGLGGCPYAKGASGNVSTEDVFYLVSGLGFQTGIDLEKLMQASQRISARLNKPSSSYYAKAYLAQA